MTTNIGKKNLFWTLLFLTVLFFAQPTIAATNIQDQIDNANKQIDVLNQQILDYQAKIKEAGAEKKTLQSAINSLDLQRKKVEAQIAATQHQIKATELQIKQLSTKINNAKEMITIYKGDLETSLRELNRSENKFIVYQLLTEDNLSDFWQNIGDNIQLQSAFQEKLKSLKAEKANLTNRQNITKQKKEVLAEQNKSLVVQKQSLLSTVKAKNQLLVETKNSEANYQKLLASAKAQLKSFSDFTKNAGGAKLVGNQTVCDDWGCYYNQRDSSWGAKSLNGTEYTLASDGCLVTSVAMVMTHFGYRSVTPASINANPDNFATYYPAFLMKTVTVAGVSATRIGSKLDSALANGNPVIVGMKVGGGTHFVVLVSGKNGQYTMRDPYISNGKDLNFTDHYAVKSIYSIETVSIRS